MAAPPVVIPVIRTVSDVAAFRMQVAKSYPAGPERDSWMPISQPLAGELGVVYTYDLENYARILAERNLPTLGLTRDQVHAHCMKNLRLHLKGKLQVSVLEDLIAIAGLNGIEASTLLAPEIWDGISGEFQGEVVAGVPVAGVLIAYVEPSPGAPKRSGVGPRAKSTFLTEGAHAWKNAPKDKRISPQYFAWRGGQWVLAGSFA